MTLDQLKVLETIVITGSFRAAAEHLHRAQSAVSYAIKGLEDELNLKLFSRASYRPELTAAGQALYQKARALLASEREFLDLSRHLSQGEEPELALSISALMPLPQLYPTFKRFQKKHKATKLKINMEVLGAMDRLLGDDADIAITEVGDFDPAQIETIPLTRIQMVPVTSRKHPLAHSKGSVERSELLRYTQITLKSTSQGSKEKTAGVFSGANVWSVTDFLSKRDLLLAGFGWGLMPTHLVEEDIQRGLLSQLPIDRFQGIHLDFFAARKRDRMFGPSGTDLWQSLCAQAQQESL